MIESLKKNILFNTLRTFVNLLVPIISFPYVTRILLAENIGKVNFAFSIISYFVMLCSLGIPLYGVREAAKVRNNKLALSKLSHELIIINIVSTGVSYLLLMLSIFIIPKLYLEKQLLLILSTTVLFTFIGLDWLYQALEKYVYITIRSLIIQVVYVMMLYSFIHKKEDYYIYAILLVFSSVGSNIFNFLNARKHISFKLLANYNFRQHLKPIMILFAMNIAISIYINLDIVMLGFFSNDRAVGLYSVGMKISKLLLAIVNSVGSILMSRITYYVQNDDKSELSKLLKKSTDFIFFTSLPLIVILFINADKVISLFSGQDFIEASFSTKILMPITILIGLSNLIGVQILIPFGKEKITLYSVVIGALINVLLNIILIPNYSQNGAAIATLVAESIVTIFQMFFVWEHIKESFLSENKLKYIFASLLLAIMLMLFNNISISSTLLSLIFISFLSCLIYFPMLYCLKEELVFELINLFKKTFSLSVVPKLSIRRK